MNRFHSLKGRWPSEDSHAVRGALTGITFNHPFLALSTLPGAYLKTLPTSPHYPVPKLGAHLEVFVIAAPHNQSQFLSWSAQAAVTKNRRLGGSNNRNVFLSVLEAGKSENKGQVDSLW